MFLSQWVPAWHGHQACRPVWAPVCRHAHLSNGTSKICSAVSALRFKICLKIIIVNFTEQLFILLSHLGSVWHHDIHYSNGICKYIFFIEKHNSVINCKILPTVPTWFIIFVVTRSLRHCLKLQSVPLCWTNHCLWEVLTVLKFWLMTSHDSTTIKTSWKS